MKIKNLIIFYPSFERGGVEMIIKNLIGHLSKKDINIFLITCKNKNLENIPKVKNLFFAHPTQKYFRFLPNRFSSAFSCIKPLIKLIKNNDQSNTVIHSMQSNFIPILIAKILKIKIIIRNSEDPIESIKYSENKLTSYLIFLLRFIFYNLSDKIITNSKGSSDSIKKFLLTKNIKNVKYIYNPYLKQINKKIFNKKTKTILAAGRLCRQKNFKDLIIAFRNFHMKNPEYKLHIFGDGYEKNMLKDLISSLKLNNHVFLKGYRKDLKLEYKKAKLFVLPSIYEGLGNVLIEALNYSVPCISTNCKSGPSEILSYGRGGYIVPIKNIDALTKTLINSISNYDISIKKMKYGKKKLNRFLINTQSTKYLEQLNSVL